MQVLTSDQPMEAEATASCSHQPPQTHVNTSPQVPAPAGPCTLSAGGCCTAPRKVGVLTEPGLETTVKAGARAMAAVADGERSDFWGWEAEEMNSEAWDGNSQHQLEGDGTSKAGFEPFMSILFKLYRFFDQNRVQDCERWWLNLGSPHILVRGSVLRGN